MKEIISSIVIIASLLGGGTAALKELHDVIRKAALEKAAEGLPSLQEMNRALQKQPTSTQHQRKQKSNDDVVYSR